MRKLLLAAGAAFLLTMPAYAANGKLGHVVPDQDVGCCSSATDEEFMFRGYTFDLWDNTPSFPDIICTAQDPACLPAIQLGIMQIVDLQKRLDLAVLFRQLWYAEGMAYVARANHFSPEPLDSMSRVGQPVLADFFGN
jgi:hypothetical protein